ncbi:MAG TPA: glycerophosphodiester phosphodiesterase, partial [Coleofasciculaceae cyanobacterium]
MPTSPLPYIMAHRGNSAFAKENTIAAFEQAIALGADGVEFDVRATQDQVLIIHHDPDVAGQRISESPWSQLKALDPDLPTLAETIACCHGRIQMDVELKEPGYEAAVVQHLQDLPLNSFVVTSFKLETLIAVKQIAPAISVGFLVEPETMQAWSSAAELGDCLQAGGINFIAPHWQMVGTEWLAHCSTHVPTPIPWWVWT